MKRNRWLGWKTLRVFPWIGVGAALAAQAGEPVRFNRDIRPILSDNCYRCHGPDSTARKGELRLDRPEGLFTKREAGTPVVAGKPQESLLVKLITAKDEDDLMPPPKSNKKLTPQQKQLLQQWIKEGAQWEPHWSFLAPKRPDLPKVKDPRWVKNPIDQFILAKLEQNRLKPASEADRRTLARRVGLDMTGLPPKLEDVEAYVADKSPDAYEKFVDKLMASPQYGEHRARYWLDAARYADTHGLHFDNYREMWPYRDWVINAFNNNVPFDKFTIEQLAGDLLPNPTLAQRIATGFQRCNITTNEGGTIPEENEANYALDRVATTGQVWLGLTLGCTPCHDHKFDPISTKEFYQMTAFYRNTTQSALDGNIPDTPPVIRVPKIEDAPRLQALPAEIETARNRIAARENEIAPLTKEWGKNLDPKQFEHPADQDKLEIYLPLRGNAERAIRNEASADAAPIALPETAEWKQDPKLGAILHLNGQTAFDLGAVGDVERTDKFSYGAWVKPSDKTPAASVLARMDEGSDYRGWDLWLENNGRRVAAHIIHKWPVNAVKVFATEDVVKPNEWNHIFVTYNGNSKSTGLKIYVNGVSVKSNSEQKEVKETIRTQVPTRIGARSKSSHLANGSVQDVRFYRRKLDADEVASLYNAGEIRAVAANPNAAGRDETIRKYYLKTQDKPYAALKDVMADLEMELDRIQKRSPVTFVMQEKPMPPKARVLFRGQYDQPREEVTPAVLSALNPMPAGAPSNRLGLAQWLVAPENPLTARVTVNRFWQEIFGTGLVKTSEDFGIMGENPSHPELLDWLAVEFRESGWDVKKMFRLMVTSAAYRQAAMTTREKLDRDPQNRLLSRGPRFRMDGEMIRDYTLAISGLLVDQIGGPSVKPYQPPGVWEAVAMIGSNTRDYRQDKGEKLYRRSMYTFWKRAAPPASMEIFNAPSRENCTVRRERTNTPLQALVTLNDPQFVEAARRLAERALKEGGATTESRADFMARRLLARPFRAEELVVVKQSFDALAKYYSSKPDDAKALIAVGESKADAALDAPMLAAWTMVANELINLDEVLNK